MSSLPEILELLVQQHAPIFDYDFPQSLSPFLKTNDLPSESDAKVLRDLSKHVSEALRLITSDMESLIGAHSQLKKIQDHLLRVDADIKTAMPPIERLPVEMLVQVFKEATSGKGNALDMRWEPFAISRVCHKWRVVATEQCPEIWTEFMLERDRWDYMKNPVALLSSVLSRGAERSLVFEFEASGGNDSDSESEKNSEEDSSDEEAEDARRPSYSHRDDGVTEQLLHDLVRHCHRWRDVYFSIPARLFHLLSPIQGKLPALVLFSLDCVTDWLAEQSSILTESHILDGAPLLEDVSVSCYQNDLPVLIPQGVPNLTSYTDGRSRVGDMTLHRHFLNIICTSPHLKSFFIRHRSPLAVPTPRVVHPGITRLSAADGTFLRSLTLPELKNVELYSSTLRSPDIHHEISSLYDLVVHSACNLSSLKVENCALNENLIHILDASPDLTSLTLQIPGWDGDSARTLMSLFDRLRSFKHVLVPRLQSLTLILKDAHFLGTDNGLFGPLFGYFIEDRWRKGILRSVTVMVIPWESEFILPQGCREKLIRLKDEGMNVKFTSHEKSLLCL